MSLTILQVNKPCALSPYTLKPSGHYPMVIDEDRIDKSHLVQLINAGILVVEGLDSQDLANLKEEVGPIDNSRIDELTNWVNANNANFSFCVTGIASQGAATGQGATPTADYTAHVGENVEVKVKIGDGDGTTNHLISGNVFTDELGTECSVIIDSNLSTLGSASVTPLDSPLLFVNGIATVNVTLPVAGTVILALAKTNLDSLLNISGFATCTITFA